MKSFQWRELAAALGVIVSLLFVGYEIRQNTQVARGQARQQLAALNQEWLVLQSQDAEFNDLWTRAWGGQDSTLTPAEWRRAQFMMTLNLRRLENVYFQHAEGLVDESALNSYGFQRTTENSDRYRTPRFREFWKERRAGYDPEFARFFEEKMGL